MLDITHRIKHRFIKGFINRDDTSQVILSQPDSILIRFSESDPDFIVIAYCQKRNGKNFEKNVDKIFNLKKTSQVVMLLGQSTIGWVYKEKSALKKDSLLHKDLLYSEHLKVCY